MTGRLRTTWRRMAPESKATFVILAVVSIVSLVTLTANVLAYQASSTTNDDAVVTSCRARARSSTIDEADRQTRQLILRTIRASAERDRAQLDALAQETRQQEKANANAVDMYAAVLDRSIEHTDDFVDECRRQVAVRGG